MGTTPVVAPGPTTLNDLGRALVAQIYESVTGGDASVPASKDNFFSWCMPGLPFEPVDFNFCVKGLGGGATAEEERHMVQQAFSFANLVDFVPDVTGVYGHDTQQTVFRTSEARLSHMYGEILRFCKVVTSDLSDNEKAKLERLRNLLRVRRKVKDPVTDENKLVTEDGPMLRAYNEKMALYHTAALLYNSKRIAAASATGPEGRAAVVDFAANASLYRQQVKAAEDAWIAGGYRNDVDRINAYINQVTQRDLMLWKQRLLEYYGDARVTGLAPGQEFFYTTLIPGNFASAAGWPTYEFSRSNVESHVRSEHNAWSGGAGLSFGLWSFGAGASGSSARHDANYAISNFKLKMQLTQVAISRPWFYPEFFMNRGWLLRKGEGWTYDMMPSDGGRPPRGVCIAYPTMALFARNIEIESAEFASAFSEFSRSITVGASVGWGPFRLSGSYSHSESGRDFRSESQAGKLTVPGMQIIGFVNHLIPKAPNPLPDLRPENFH